MMKQINILIGLMVLTIMPTACKKDIFKNEISGYVKEAGTGKPLEGVEVALFSACYGRNLNQAGSCPNGDTKLYKTTTSPAGYYCIRYDKYRNDEKYFMAFNNGKHFLEEYAIPDKTKNKLTYSPNLLAPAKVLLHIKNVNPYDGYDQIIVFASDYDSNQSSFDFYFKGMSIDTIFGPLNITGNKPRDLYFNITKNGIVSVKKISVNVEGFKTTTIDVNY
jgi:hypothetical protein